MIATNHNGRNSVEDPSILIIGSPYQHPNKKAFTGKFIEILETVAGSVQYIGSNSPDEEPESVTVKPVEFAPVDSIQSRLIKYVYYQIIAIVAFERMRPDAVIVRPQHLLLLTIYFRLRRVRFSVFAAQRQESPIIRKLSKWTFRIAEFLIIESTDSFEWHGQVVSDKILDGRTYVDLNRFTKLSIETSDSVEVGYLGLLSDRKGIPQLIDAIKLVNAEHQEKFEFHFGGSGKYEEQLSKLSNKYDNVSFAGFVPNDELAEFYNELDILILPSESEGLPNVVLESMACGTPALVTNVGGIPYLIKDETNGFILSNRTPEAIFRRLIEISESNNLSKVADSAASTIQSKYAREDARERYERIIQSLCYTKTK